jgi:hypothetical protein
MINIALRHKGQEMIPGLRRKNISRCAALERTSHPGGIDPLVELLFAKIF